MKRFRFVVICLSLVALTCGLLAAAGVQATKKAPDKLIFPAKVGNVTFAHAEHIKRADGKCAVCHPKLFPQSAKAPLNFKAGMHKPAEAKKTSCAACHHAGGTSFQTKGNCKKCHVRKKK